MTLVAPEVFNDTKMAEALYRGFPMRIFAQLKEALDVPTPVLTEALHISKRTLERRQQKNEPLNLEESERLLRYARILTLATEVLGSKKAAQRWLQEPHVVLNGETPFQFARTEPGARLVELELNRLEYGVFS